MCVREKESERERGKERKREKEREKKERRKRYSAKRDLNRSPRLEPLGVESWNALWFEAVVNLSPSEFSAL